MILPKIFGILGLKTGRDVRDHIWELPSLSRVKSVPLVVRGGKSGSISLAEASEGQSWDWLLDLVIATTKSTIFLGIRRKPHHRV